MKKSLIIVSFLILLCSIMFVSCDDLTVTVDTTDEVTTEEETDTDDEETTDEDTTEADTTADETTKADTTAAVTTAKPQETAAPQQSTEAPQSSSGSLTSGGSIAGGSTSGSQTVTTPGGTLTDSTAGGSTTYITTKSGKKLVHTYSNKAVGSEDNSTAIAYMPMKSSVTLSDPKAVYNLHQVLVGDIKPGLSCNGVLVGYDGYMFYQDTINDFVGSGFLTTSVYDRSVKMLKDRNDWCKANGKKFYFVIAPNKNSVYPDYMPEGYTLASYRRYDQFVKMLNEAGITAVDLRGAMSAAVKEAPERNLYYKYDTHWNNHAGFIAYTTTMNMIKKDYPNVVIHSKNEYQINYCETYMKDQAYYLGYYDYFTDYGPVYTLKSKKTAKLINYTPRDGWGQFAFANVWPDGFCDKLYYFQYRNDNNKNAPNIYIMRDSYSIAMIPFLKDSFYQSTYNWTFSFSENEILKSDSDIVMVIVAERNLKNYVNQKSVTD